MNIWPYMDSNYDPQVSKSSVLTNALTRTLDKVFLKFRVLDSA